MEPSNYSTLLSSENDPSLNSRRSKLTKIILISLIITTLITLITSITFACLFFNSKPQPFVVPATARPLTKLKHPVVILISLDGFRFGYQHKASTPNIYRLIKNGTEAEQGLIPVFPTLTFPNHFSIVTGLYPAHHGIISNKFTDPETGEVFTIASKEPKWWIGEPLWETVVKAGKIAATYFWPGSQVKKPSWNCPVEFCPNYNRSVPFEDRVDTILGYFDLKVDEIPVLMTLYFEDPDKQGHEYGPDHQEISKAIANIDVLIGRLIDGLEKRGVFEDVTIMLVSDHGMVGNCDSKLIHLNDLSPWVNISEKWVDYYSPILAIRPSNEYNSSDIVEKMNKGLDSYFVENGKNLRVFLKEDLPARLQYAASERIPPIIGLVDEGYKVKEKRSSNGQECGGSHGYDNEFFSMRAIFIAHGPQFARGRKVPSFQNVEIYNLITSILKIQGAPNNGSVRFSESVILPYA